MTVNEEEGQLIFVSLPLQRSWFGGQFCVALATLIDEQLTRNKGKQNGRFYIA